MPNEAAGTLLATIRRLAAELHSKPQESIAVSLDSSLERDLGFDSLGRVELLARIDGFLERHRVFKRRVLVHGLVRLESIQREFDQSERIRDKPDALLDRSVRRGKINHDPFDFALAAA